MSNFYLVVYDDSIGDPFHSESAELQSSGKHNNGTGYDLSHCLYKGRPNIDIDDCSYMLDVDDANSRILQVFQVEMTDGRLPEEVWYFDSYDNHYEDRIIRYEAPPDELESDEQGGYWIHIIFGQEYTDNP
jgi:hypothetical protein